MIGLDLYRSKNINVNIKINLDCNKHKLKHKYDLQKLTTKKKIKINDVSEIRTHGHKNIDSSSRGERLTS